MLIFFSELVTPGQALHENSPNMELLSGPYFPVFGLNTERYEVSFRIHSKYGKIRTRKSSVFGQFLRSEVFAIK